MLSHINITAQTDPKGSIPSEGQWQCMTGALGQLEGDLRIHWPMHAAAMCSSCSLLLKYYCASLILLNFSDAAQCSASCGLYHVYYMSFLLQCM